MSHEPVWFPSETYQESTRLYQWMKDLGYGDYDTFQADAVTDIDWFWHEAERALGVEWKKPYEQAADTSEGYAWPTWFRGGALNVTETAVEKWAAREDTKNQPAIIWEAETNETRQYTFQELEDAVNEAAAGLQVHGIERGDVVALYMPMVPETLVAMLACSKIGAIFTPSFSGYAADAVRTRLDAAGAKMLITCDGFTRRGKPVPMKEEADRAVEGAKTVKKVVVVPRLNRDVTWHEDRDVAWSNLFGHGHVQEAAAMAPDEEMMLIYTSGTTGQPKGAVHTHAGFPIKAAFDAGICMDVKQHDRLFWYTDMGWMMGPFLVYGALLNGAAVKLFDGSPDYPEPDRLWDLVDKYEVTHLGISPTLIRALMKQGNDWVNQHSLESLRVIGSTGEPWNPEPWFWLFREVGGSRIPIFNYSGGTEISGGILGNILIKPIGPITFNAALPGMDARVYDEDGQEVVNDVGELVLTKPWVGMTKGFWHEPERFEKTYWSRFENAWVHGDWVIQDSEGYWTITGRSDDILNVAGKRLGPSEMESVLVEHPAVVEAGTIGVPDEMKGESAVSFVVLHPDYNQSDELMQELIALCGEKLGKSLRPKAVYAVDDLPKTRNAKVMRRVIRAAYIGKDPGDLSSLENPHTVEAIKKLAHNLP
ncbi:acetyl-CoA synthetase [Salsuginibacillus halophilus]|uniref:acetate--CoA ligase n=1 Tax=Salsuginibacillus halophilus TaxID=517424 RepID=A0A2P8HG21_9BACI|nr:AMP-binding protein [Salsuginibacillus halophilus]PSL45178.1 acetyl-CoA synthetase [Salsuginibacillus halophilus]